jgi:hypothetical protein
MNLSKRDFMTKIEKELLAIETMIYIIRDQRVMIDSDLAKLYGVETKQLNRQVQRNFKRFPPDFMFQLTEIEEESLRCQFGTSKEGKGGRRYLHYVFTRLDSIEEDLIPRLPSKRKKIGIKSDS